MGGKPPANTSTTRCPKSSYLGVPAPASVDDWDDRAQSSSASTTTLRMLPMLYPTFYHVSRPQDIEVRLHRSHSGSQQVPRLPGYVLSIDSGIFHSRSPVLPV